MEVTAKARFIRMSPRKVRLVADVIRGLDVAAARAQLKFLRKAAARPVLKVLESAIANASHNHQMEAAGLFVKSIAVDAGPTLKRWRPRAYGRAASIKKRTSHVFVVLANRLPAAAPKGASAAVVAPAAKPAKSKETSKAVTGSAAKVAAPQSKKPTAKSAKSEAAAGGKGGSAAKPVAAKGAKAKKG